MNLKNLILIAFAFVMTSSVYAQGNILNAKTPEEMFVRTEGQIANDNDVPLPYGYVEDLSLIHI